MLIAGHTNPTSQTWLTQWFNFYEPTKGNEASVTVADTVDFTRVNVLYAPYRAPAARTAMAARSAAKPVPLEGQPKTVTATTAPRRPRMLAAPPAAHRTLVIEGFQAPGDVALRVRIFLNKEDATEKTPLNDPHYAGTVFIVPMHAAMEKMKEANPPPRNIALDVTQQKAVMADETPPKVTLVPVDRQGKLSKAKVTFKGVSIAAEGEQD